MRRRPGDPRSDERLQPDEPEQGDEGPAIDGGLEPGADPGATDLGSWLRRRRKAFIGAIAFALTYAAAKLGLDLDADLSAAIATTLAGIIIERTTNR
jgi:hypothetical protein